MAAALPRRRSEDGVMRADRGVPTRLLQVDRDAGRRPRVAAPRRQRRAARGVTPGFSTAAQTLEVAVQRMRFALGVDDDYREFYDVFRGDKLLGPATRRRPWLRPKRQPWPWQALAWP